jgi:ketosteroid isomerase-like protein
MSATENKKLMQQIFAELSAGESKLFGESIADDLRWTVMGTSAWSRSYDGKAAVTNELLVPLFSRFATRYKATADRFIAEDDCVVVEFHGEVMTKAGKPYNNRYCCIYRFTDGKIREVTEYLDTELVTATLS